MEITAPAKLNLYLGVTGRRGDGYHEIETLFEKISIADTITVSFSGRGTKITSTDPSIPTGEDSLLGRAVSRFKKASRSYRDFSVKLEKNIPVGAGLGGGSSDAAALLKGLNNITGNPLKSGELRKIAVSLGADVPFFMEDFAFASATGIGDIVKNINTEIKLSHVLVNPPFQTFSGNIYENLTRLGLTKGNAWDRMLSAFLSGGKLSEIGQNLRNDLQQIVLREFPVLDRVFFVLRAAGAEGVLVSGSGPTVFGIFAENKIKEAVKSAISEFPASEGWKVFEAYTYSERL